jgi:hypothetical protein
MFTGGVGALVDLPNFAVLVGGLDEWRYDNLEWEPLTEPRLLDAVRRYLGPAVTQLRPAPWMNGMDRDPAGPASWVGVPVTPFPKWLRCTACDILAPLDTRMWEFVNSQPRRPDQATFFHSSCGRSKKKQLAVTARFLVACTDGHLDEFPYLSFVHARGGACDKVEHPTLTMKDHGGNQGANVTIICTNCNAKRNIREATGPNGPRNLPRCRGRHPHLGTFAPTGCEERTRMVVVGASNQWFAQTLSTLAVPASGQSALEAKIEQLWEHLQKVTTFEMLDFAWGMPTFQGLHQWQQPEVFDAVTAHRKHLEATATSQTEPPAYPDLLTPEWEIFTAPQTPDANPDFTIRRDPDGVPAPLAGVFSDVVRAERLREVRALIGFTRLDAPDPEEPDLVKRAPLARDTPTWVPASEVRGEGIFLRIHEDLITTWQQRVEDTDADRVHRAAYREFRRNRYSDRIARDDPDIMRGWPGLRYYALHTLSHLLIRTIALECGYNSASLSERIYAGDHDDPRAGILIYTAVPDAEGTLGGLVALADPTPLTRLVTRAWHEARHCSSDPLCAERLPQPPEDFLHGAACHACLFVSETTCERGNRFLDRRFVVPLLGDDDLALIPQLGQ